MEMADSSFRQLIQYLKRGCQMPPDTRFITKVFKPSLGTAFLHVIRGIFTPRYSHEETHLPSLYWTRISLSLEYCPCRLLRILHVLECQQALVLGQPTLCCRSKIPSRSFRFSLKMEKGQIGSWADNSNSVVSLNLAYPRRQLTYTRGSQLN